MQCMGCGERVGLGALFGSADLRKPMCVKCQRIEDERLVLADRAARQAERERQAELAARLAAIILTTTPGVEGRRVTGYLGIESVEIVVGTGLFSELTGDLADFFGKRSKAFEGKLRDAKDLAFRMMRERALEAGADAVVAIDLDYTEFSGNRVALILNGTLVRLADEFGGEDGSAPVSLLMQPMPPRLPMPAIVPRPTFKPPED